MGQDGENVSCLLCNILLIKTIEFDGAAYKTQIMAYGTIADSLNLGSELTSVGDRLGADLCCGLICVVGILVLWADLCCGQTCAVGRFVLWTDLCCGQTCVVGRLLLWADLCCGQTCAVGRLVLWAELCCGQTCVVGRFVLVAGL